MPRTTAISRLRRLLTVKTFFAPSVLPPELVEELAGLRGRKAQSAVVDAFCAAARRYDDGHRPYDGTTMDVMLDDVFPAYGSTAILRLLGRFKKAAYLGNDGMHALFAPALARLDSAADGEKLVAFFHAFVTTELDQVHPDLDRVAAGIRATRRHLARAPGTLRAIEREWKTARAAQDQERRLDATLHKISPRQLERLVASDGIALCHGHRCTSSFEQAMLRQVPRLRPAVLEAFVERALDRPETYVVTASVPYLFLRDPAGGSRAALRLAGRGRESRLALIDGLECLLRWARDARGSDDAPGRIGKRRPVRTAMTRTLAALRRLDTRASAAEGKEETLRLAAAPAAELARIVASSGHLLARDHPAFSAFHAAIARHRLPAGCFAAMADRCLEREGNSALEPALAYMFLVDPTEARRHVLERGFGPGSDRGWLNNALMELAREYTPEDASSRPWLTTLHERPAAARAIRSTKRALQPAFLDPLDRV